jgi:DNA-binding transcriptional LysR family regulator
MRYKGLDLNLLVALDALVDERSVSRAAERLNMSQPAMSAALARLRDYFDDPILGAHGKRMIPTAHALILKPMLRDLLNSVDAMVSVSAAFDPAKSERHFRIGASDYIATVICNALVAQVRRLAPKVTIELVAPFDGQVALLEQGEVDVLLTPDDHVSHDHPCDLLFEERYVVAGWRDNPMLDQPITEEQFFASGHVAVEIGRTNRTSFAEVALRTFGARRRIEVLVGSFLLAPELVVNTDRLTVMQERLAAVYARRLPLRLAPMPFPFPVMREMVQYNRTRAADTGLHWMIDQIRNAIATTTSGEA